MNNRIQKIKSKGFNIPIQDDTDVYSQSFNTIDFSRIKVGAKSLDDAVITIGDLKRANQRLFSLIDSLLFHLDYITQC